MNIKEKAKDFAYFAHDGQVRKKYCNLSRKLINFLVMTYTDPLTSLKRDYTSSLALEERSFLNLKNIDNFNGSMQALKGLFNESVNTSYLADTTNTSIRDTSVNIANKILPEIRKKYIKNIKRKI